MNITTLLIAKMKWIIPVVCFSLLPCMTDAQIDRKQEIELLSDKSEWFEGMVILDDGTTLLGMVRYNDKNGVLSYFDGVDSKSFTPRTVSGFEFFDEGVQRQRIFSTFLYKESKKDIERPQFFELLVDFKTFAMILKINPVSTSERGATSTRFNGANPVVDYGGTTVEVLQEETICFVNGEGVIEPYLKTTTAKDGARSNRTGKDEKEKSKLVASFNLIENYVPKPIYIELLKYSQANNLSFGVKDDLIRIMTFCQEIMK